MKTSKAIQFAGAGLIGLGLLVLLDAWLLERVFFSLKRYQIGGEPGKEKMSLKLVHLTDLHLKQRLGFKHSRLIKKINKLKPDVLLISGDTIDEEGRLEQMDEFLSRIHTAIKILAIPGNHEYKADPDMSEIRKIYEKHHAHLLVNDTRVLRIRNRSFAVTGMDDLIEGNADFGKAIEGVRGEKNHIMLIHNPKQQEKIKNQIKALNRVLPKDEKLHISYFFAGHNHGGQVRIGNYAPKLTGEGSEYLEGWYNDKKPHLYLSRGFGTTSVPFRLMAPAEITVFDYWVE